MARPVRSIARRMPAVSTITFLAALLLSVASLAYAGWHLRDFVSGGTPELTPLIGLAIAFGVFGLFGNFLLLSMKRSGLFAAWLLILTSLVGTFYGMYLFSQGLKQLTPAHRGPFILKGSLGLGFCYFLMVLYLYAVKRAADFLRR